MNNPIRIDYNDALLRVLVEEYITQQRGSFTLNGVCSYVLYWAMGEGKCSQSGFGLFVGNKICQAYCDRIDSMLAKITSEGRISSKGNQFEILM